MLYFRVSPPHVTPPPWKVYQLCIFLSQTWVRILDKADLGGKNTATQQLVFSIKESDLKDTPESPGLRVFKHFRRKKFTTQTKRDSSLPELECAVCKKWQDMAWHGQLRLDYSFSGFFTHIFWKHASYSQNSTQKSKTHTQWAKLI